MSRPISPVNSPVNRAKLPSRIPQPNLDFYVFPFYPALGFTDRGTSLNVSEKLYNSIIQGNKPIVLKWMNSEEALKWDEETFVFTPESPTVKVPNQYSTFLRQVQRGKHFTGKIISSDYSVLFDNKNTGFTNAKGDAINYLEQSVQKRIVMHTTTKFFYYNPRTQENEDIIQSNLQRLFFVIPEIAGEDVLIIENMRVERKDPKGGKIDHLEIVFTSLGDKLSAVGKTLDGLINFGGAGEQNPFPQVAPIQPNNNSLFYNKAIEADDVPNSKRIYFADSLKTNSQGVKGFQIDFNGLAKVDTIEFYGRKKLSSKERNGVLVHRVGRCKKLLLHNVGKPRDEIKNEIDNYNVAFEKEFRATQSAVQHLNWFINYTDELGWNFDPTKSRENTGILWTATVNENGTGGYSGAVFLLGSTTRNKGEIFGRNYLALSKWSKYTLNPTKATAAQEKPDFSSNSLKVNMNMGDFLNMNGIYLNNHSILEYEGIKLSNIKNFAQKIINGVFSVGGTILGAVSAAYATKNPTASAAGGYIGLQLGQQIGNFVFDLLPSSLFDKSSTFRPAVKTSGLLSKRFLDDVYIKLGDAGAGDLNEKHRIPLALFNEPNNNYLSGMLSSKTYNTTIFGEITDKFNIVEGEPQGKEDPERKRYDPTVKYDTISFGATENVIVPLSKSKTEEIEGALEFDNNIIHSLPPDQDTEKEVGVKETFVIDFVVVKALTKAPIKISFYDENGGRSWTTTMLTQSAFSDNILEFETSILLSDIRDGNLSADEKYALPAKIKAREPEEIEIDDTPPEMKKEMAEKYLKALTEITVIPSFHLKNRSMDVSRSDLSTINTWTFRLNENDLRTNLSQSNWAPFSLPNDIVKNLDAYYVDEPEKIFTIKQKIKELREEFGFGKYLLDTSNFTTQAAWQEVYPTLGTYNYTFLQTHRMNSLTGNFSGEAETKVYNQVFYRPNIFLPDGEDSGGERGSSKVALPSGQRGTIEIRPTSDDENLELQLTVPHYSVFDLTTRGFFSKIIPINITAYAMKCFLKLIKE